MSKDGNFQCGADDIGRFLKPLRHEAGRDKVLPGLVERRKAEMYEIWSENEIS